MKIAIDARMYGLEHAGIGRYVMNLINQIEKLDEKNQYFILLRKKYFRDLNFKSKRFKKIMADYPHYSLKEQIILPLQLIKLKPDLAHFPHFNVPIFWWGRQVVTIHDLIKHESKGPQTTTRWQPFYWLKYIVYKFIVWLAVKRAAKIIVPSHWWKKELIRRYKLQPTKIAVTYEGVNEEFHQSPITNHRSQRILKQYGIVKPFIIYTGSLYPHKNVERLVKAVKLVNSNQRPATRKKPITDHRSPITLLIVCARSVFYDRFKKKVQQMKAENFVNLIGFVPDKDLVALYRQAEAFVFPSLLEGFGLPGLEAMATGCPVVCSDIPVLREVYGEAAEYFNPLDINDMAKKIKMVIEDDERKQKLKKLGLELVERYSWKKMAKETLRVYDSLIVPNDDRIDPNRIKSKIVLPHLSYKIMGILFKVHNELGPSLLEKYYQRGISKELKRSGLKFKKEVPIKIQYQNENIGRYFLDFVIEDLVILEVKAQRYYTPKFFKQALSYLKETNLPLVIIVNFRGDKLRYKRVVNPAFKNVDLTNRDLELESIR